MINFSLQQVAKFAIWYTQAGTEILMRFINALVKSSEYTTGLDKILLEKLKELEQDLEEKQNSPREKIMAPLLSIVSLFAHYSLILKRPLKQSNVILLKKQES